MSSTIVPPQPLRRETLERPKARFFGFLSLVWGGFMVMGPVIFIWIWPESPVTERNSAGTDWFRTLAWGLLASEIIFILLAVGFWLFEKPRRVVRYVTHDLPGGPVIH